MKVKLNHKEDGVDIEVDDNGVRANIDNGRVKAEVDVTWSEARTALETIGESMNRFSMNDFERGRVGKIDPAELRLGKAEVRGDN